MSERVGFRIRPDEGGGFELISDDVGVAHDRFGVYVLLHGRSVANVCPDEADQIARVLPWHAQQARQLQNTKSKPPGCPYCGHPFAASFNARSRVYRCNQCLRDYTAEHFAAVAAGGVMSTTDQGEK